MKNAIPKTNEGKVRFNEAEKNLIRAEIDSKVDVYFGSIHRDMKDLSANVSEKVVKDVSEVINPALNKFFDMDKKTNKRIDKLEIIGLSVMAVIFVALIWIAAAQNKKQAVIGGQTRIERPFNITGAR